MKGLNFRWIAKFIFPTLIILTTGFLALRNYEPGTYLSGWDTLHPEFNLNLYLKRIFFGAWQEHQGVGAAASQAHAAELPRILLVFILTKILPLSDVRYAFFVLSLSLGALGIYFLSKYLLARDKNRFVLPAAFLASIFYVFNLTTVQQFYVPLEMFAVHFATLPWLFFLAIKYLRENTKKILFYFSVVTFFSTAMAHTATLFYVYLAAFVVYIFSVLFLSKRKLQIKRGVLLVILTLAINSFWLLPNLYFIKNHSQEVSSSKIHTIFSDEAFLQGKSFGDLEDLALSKNFLFNWREFDANSNSFVSLLNEWQDHLNRPYVNEIGYILFALTVFGIYVSLLSKSKYVLSFIPLLGISIFFWINSNPPFEAIFEYLRDNIELFKEGLRFPFTKFSILLVFSLTVYFGFSMQFIFEKLKKIVLAFIFFLAVAGSIFYFAKPAFYGGFISPSMRVEIPDDYFEMFNYFEEKDITARVAKVPLQTFWGWNFYDWDYQGAGLTWFGLEQPTFDREFDRWSSYNEGFYNEISFALYSNDQETFLKVLEKYQVDYLLLDESVLNAGGNSDILYIDEIKNITNQTDRITLEKQFDFLSVYRVDLSEESKYFSIPSRYVLADNDMTYSQKDIVYQEIGDYVFDKEGISYPFANLDSRMGVEVELGFEKVSVIANPLTFFGTKIIDSPKTNEDYSVFVNNAKEIEFTYTPREKYVKTPDTSTRVNNCDLGKLGEVSKEVYQREVLYKAQNGGVACDFVKLPELMYSNGYIFRIKGENKLGRSLKVYLQNSTTKRMDLEVLLPKEEFDETYFILPTSLQGSGYTLNLETRSYGDVASINTIEKIELISYPAKYLEQIKLVPEIYSVIQNDAEILTTDKIGSTHYLAKVKGPGLLVFGQGHEDGWQAHVITSNKYLSVKRFLPWFFGEKLEHVKVNSWENGWYLPEGENVVVVTYSPQYLEYIGFAILIYGFTLIVRKNERI